MAEVDLRDIILAFHEKGWNLYESVAGFPGIEGPVDNLLDGIPYAVLPVMRDPSQLKAALHEAETAIKVGMSPKFHDGQGNTFGPIEHVFVYLSWDTPTLQLWPEFSSRHVDLPLETAAERIRECFSEYHKEKAQNRHLKKLGVTTWRTDIGDEE